MLRRSAVLALVAALAASCADTPPDDSPPPVPNGPRTIVLVSIDTLRPDRLGVHGNDEGVSPRIDALARDAVVFDAALATSPWTLPSHMSMLTGLDPLAHGVRDRGFHLSTAAYTLAEALHDAGFATGAFTDGGFVSASYGYDQGFDVFDSERAPGGKADNGFARLLPDALTWLDEHLDDDLFLFVHTFDVHAPFHEVDDETAASFRARPVTSDPRDPLLHRARYLKQQHDVGVSRYDTLSALLADYDAGVHVADRGVGELLDLLRRRGRYDDALVIVTSDHGESFFDHGAMVGHAMTLYDSELAIPLVVKLPRGEAAGTRVETPVDLTDLAPTILHVAGLDVPSDMSGDSLVDLVRGDDYERPPILAMSTNVESYALVDGSHKYISAMAVTPAEASQILFAPTNPPLGGRDVGSEYDVGTGDRRETLRYDFVGDPLGILDVFVEHEQLFDRAADPHERDDLSTRDPERLAAMRRRLLELWDSSSLLNDVLVDQDENPDIPFSPGEAHALAMLGYLDTGSRTELRAVPKPLRRNVTDVDDDAPDMSALREQDRVVHALRRAHAAGELGDDAAELMQTAGDAYADWAVAHEHHAPRALWRLFELGALAKDAGIRLDVTAWLQSAAPRDG